MSNLAPELLEILACPDCKSPVKEEGDDKLRCTKCGKAYAIVDGIPDFVEPLKEEG